MNPQSLKIITAMHPDPRIRKDLMVAWIQVEAEMAQLDNVEVIIIEGGRSFERSEELYAQGRTAPGEIVTWARAGESYHNYDLAFDFGMITNGHDDFVVGPHWMKVVAIMKSHGWTWGGDFPKGKTDNPHFEKRLGYNWRQLLVMYNHSQFIPGTKYLQL